MKTFTLAFFVFMSVPAFAEQMIFCPMLYLKKVKAVAEEHSENDKNRRCVVSCLLTLKCSSWEVTQIGLMKEVVDMVGPGDADWKDLRANTKGIHLVLDGIATDKRECLQGCDQFYSNP